MGRISVSIDGGPNDVLALPPSDGSIQWGPTGVTIFLVVWVLVGIFLAVVYFKRRK